MNKYLKALLYIILLPISMFGSAIAALIGLVLTTVSFVSVMQHNYYIAIISLLGALICIGLMKMFKYLDPSYLYWEYDEW